MFFAFRLGTGFGRDVDGTTLGIDEVIDVSLSNRYFSSLLMSIFRLLWQDSEMVSIMA